MLKKIRHIYNAAHDAPMLIDYKSDALCFVHMSPTIFGSNTKLKYKYSIRPKSEFSAICVNPAKSEMTYFYDDDTSVVKNLNVVERITAKFILRYFRDMYHLKNVWGVARGAPDDIERYYPAPNIRPEYRIYTHYNSHVSNIDTKYGTVIYHSRFNNMGVTLRGVSGVIMRQILKRFYNDNKLRMMMNGLRVRGHVFA